MSTSLQQPSDPPMLRADDAGVTTLTLNRPARYNALTVELVTRLDDTVNEYARNIAEKLPIAIRTGKAMFYRQLNMDLPDAFEYAGELMARDMMEADVMEGIDAFVEKRDPVWK